MVAWFTEVLSCSRKVFKYWMCLDVVVLCCRVSIELKEQSTRNAGADGDICLLS